MEDDLPDEVRRFVVAYIASVSSLEALLLLRGTPDRDWRAVDVAHRLFVRPSQAERLLDELAEHGLVVKQAESSFRYSPDPELAALVDRVAETHSKRLLALTKLIHTLSSHDAQQFSDAFRLRKEKK